MLEAHSLLDAIDLRHINPLSRLLCAVPTHVGAARAIACCRDIG